MRYKFTEAQRDEIKARAIEFWDKATHRQAKFYEKINDYNRLYHIKLPESLENEMAKHPDRSSLVPPDVYNNILALEAAVIKLIFGKKPYARITLEGQLDRRSDIINKAERKLTELIELGRFAHFAKPIIKQVAIAGRSCAFTQWQPVYRPKVVRDDRSNKITGINRERIAAYPICKPIDIRRVRIDDKAESIPDIAIVGYHAKVNYNDLLTWNRDPNNFISFKDEDLNKTHFPANRYYEYVSEEHGMYDHENDSVSYGDRPVELIDIRGIFNISGEPMDLIVKIANRDLIVECRENDLPIFGPELFTWPALDSEFGRIFPMGVVEPAFDLFIEEWAKKNQALDAASRNIYDMYLADAAACADLPDRIPYVGGKIIKLHLGATGSPNVSSIFAPIPKAAQIYDTFQQAASIQQDIQQTMRQNDYKQGTDPSRKETATAVTELVIGGQRLDEMIVDQLKDTFFVPTMKNFLILWNYFNNDKISQVTDEEGQVVNIFPGELDFPFNVAIDVSSAIERPMVQRRIVESYPFMANDPNYDPYELRKTFVWALNLPNPDKILPDPRREQMVIDRENSAMLNGTHLPVHPADPHQKHITGHQQAMQQLVEVNLPEQEKLKALGAFDNHLAEHESYSTQQQQNPGNPNMNSGGSASQGSMAGGAAPKIPNLNQPQPTSSR